MATVTFKGTPVELQGNHVSVGDKAPDFDAVGLDLSPQNLAATAGKVRIFSVVPSLDTPVCHLSTKRWNDEVAELGDDVVVCTVSVDTPFAMGRWSKEERAENVTYISDFRARSFGEAYGVTIGEGALKSVLARALFVVDKHDKVVFAQYVPEITENPDFDGAIAAVKAARG